MKAIIIDPFKVEVLHKAYLAIPYTGIKELSYQESTRMCAAMVAKEKVNVFSPITHSHPLTTLEGISVPGDWGYWQKVDYQFLDWADELRIQLIFPDDITKSFQLIWDSTGVQAEIAYANKIGIPISIYRFTNQERTEYEILPHKL